jgi:alpha-beta hydrolase superfamily lysophospholipase
MTLAERSDISAAIVDSTYSSIGRVLRSWVGDEAVYQGARENIQEEAGFDIEELDALAVAPNVMTPVCFVQAMNDQVVVPECKKFFDAVGSPKKEYLPFSGGHVSYRPESVTEAVFQFIIEALA